jgi:hypothetical protein
MSKNRLTEDPGWDKALIYGHDQLVPPKNKILREKIIDPGLICSSGGNIYVFHPSFNSWFVLMDIQAVLFLNSVMGLEMASVNYDKAFKGYIRYLESRAMDMGANEIPTSICVSSRRMTVEYTGTSLKFSLCQRIVNNMPERNANYDIVASLSYMSLDLRYFKDEWRPSYRHALYRYVARLFEKNPIGLETLKWIVGRSLLDPTSFNKVLCLFGEGMKGKSKVLQALMVSLKGCVASIPEKYLVSMTAGVPSELKEMVISNRLLLAGDVDTYYSKTNLAFIKSLTGQDYVSMPPTSVKSRCSLVYNTNKLDTPRDNPEWSTPAIARRFNVVHMNTNVVGGVDEEVPQDYNSRIDWACHCIWTVLSNPDMPMSLEDLLLSLLQSELFDAIQYLSYVDPKYADDEETMTANSILASYMNVETWNVGSLAARRTRQHIKIIDQVEYVVGIVPSVNYK